MGTQMSREEIDEFLDEQRTLILVTLRPDGSPVAHALWFTRLGESLYINTRIDSLKYRHIEKDPRVCALVEDGESYFELRGVRVEGRCVHVEDRTEIARVEEVQRIKDERIGSGMGELPAWFSDSRSRRLAQGSRVVLRIPMERVYSWDFSKARAHYEGKR
ncbi:MAG: pyridoxamine 5'-phosphate oxidase family protein [Myxococcota bacterium]